MARPSQTEEPITATLAVSRMTCAACVRRVERALGKVPGVENAAVNLATEQAIVILGGQATINDLVSAVDAAGYRATPVIDREESAAANDREHAEEARRRHEMRVRYEPIREVGEWEDEGNTCCPTWGEIQRRFDDLGG